MANETKRRGSIIVRVALVMFSVWMIYYLGSLIKEYSSLKNELITVTAKRQQLSLEVEEKSKLLETGNEVDFIEKAAREKLGYVYADEHIYIDISGD